MRTAEITNHDGTGYMVQLMDNGNLFGTIDVRSKSTLRKRRSGKLGKWYLKKITNIIKATSRLNKNNPSKINGYK